ncbi:hypothetical protein CDAR_437091 [Caerostris darwini]|uniref:Uncharacterized protein n=1 Tax=Caerostris darwini TaxID=1538125 RepID=A0AAV4TRE6_9ARAC|nr:hypothetical protein CDAR_437091 [Caerostris darwini]
MREKNVSVREKKGIFPKHQQLLSLTTARLTTLLQDDKQWFRAEQELFTPLALLPFFPRLFVPFTSGTFINNNNEVQMVIIDRDIETELGSFTSSPEANGATSSTMKESSSIKLFL